MQYGWGCYYTGTDHVHHLKNSTTLTTACRQTILNLSESNNDLTFFVQELFESILVFHTFSIKLSKI